MDIGSATSTALPLQVAAALAAIQQSQAEELAVAATLEQSFQAASAPVNPDLGQLLDLTI
jgi:hypothetical protein